jgi:hypothetical protein
MTQTISVFRLFFFSFPVLLLCSAPGNAQTKKKYLHDENYYEMYQHKLTARVYVSQKFLELSVPPAANGEDLEYKSNSKRNLGLGVTWHNYSLNAFYGFSFLNKNAKEKGKTKGLNLQFHLYPHKWAIDLYAVFPKGEYLSPKGYAASGLNSYYYRPDVKMALLGLSAYKVPNKEKFSYRAAIVQNEWQKKSAGSVLYGGEVYHGTIQGDSTLVPKVVESGFPQAGIKKIDFLRIGPGAGYAYTLVIDHHFFIMASLVGNINFTSAKEEKASSTAKKSAISPSAVYKAGIGYNSSTWALVASLTGSQWWLKGASSAKDYVLPTGAYRISLSKKIDLNKHRPNS